MSELHRLAQPLLDRPLAEPPSVDDLRRRNRRRRRRHAIGGGTALAVLALVVALVVSTLPAPSPSTPSRSTPGVSKASTLADFIQAGVSVPDSVLETVGLPSSVTLPTTLQGQPPLTDQGKPAVVYVGGEFCPFCAVQRWALVVALSRFGTFAHLGQIISSDNGLFGALKSWSFHGSSYQSSVLSFDPAEIFSSTPTSSTSSTGVGYEPLDSLTPVEASAYDTYATGPGGSRPLPFVDVDNRYVAIGASANPTPLEGLSLDQIAADLNNPSSPVAQALDGVANSLIAAICGVVGTDAAPICSSPMVAQAQARMGS